MELSPIDPESLVDLRLALGFADVAFRYLAGEEKREREIRAHIAAYGPDIHPVVHAVLTAELEDAVAAVTLARTGAFFCQRALYEQMAAMLRIAGHPW